MSTESVAFRGSLVALVTPMLADGSLDIAGFERLVAWHIEQGTQGLVIVGTTGESGTVESDEHYELVERALAVADRRVPIIAGCGGTSTAKVCAMVKRLNQLKPDGYLSVTPYYIKPTQQGMMAHFRAIADHCDAPLLLYNVPGRTAIDLSNETVAELASHVQIAGIKDAVGDVARSRELFGMVPEHFCLLSGDDETALEFVLAGGHGVISVTSNVAPKMMSDWVEAALKGDEKRARTLFEPLLPLHRALFVEANPIPVKYAVHCLQAIEETIRLPLTPATPETKTMINRVLTQLNLN